MTEWANLERPGYFGRKRDEKIAKLNETYGKDGWRLVWEVLTDGKPIRSLEFEQACIAFYEHSYLCYFSDRPEEVDFVCSFGECIDNAITNIESGLDYTKQESFSTHIQDIALRNVLNVLGRKFEGPKDKILVIRSRDSNGFRFGPGNIPFYESRLITQPSLCPRWANTDSVEDFWQSNKWVQILRNEEQMSFSKDVEKSNRVAFKEFADTVRTAERDSDRIAGIREAMKVLDERVAAGGFAEKVPSFAQSFIDTVRTILH